MQGINCLDNLENHRLDLHVVFIFIFLLLYKTVFDIDHRDRNFSI